MRPSTLEAARAGDERAFADLTAPHLRELHVHCYRMLGSLTDADDLLQETLVAAWGGLEGFAGRSSLRAWLYKIATNRCLNAIRAAQRRRRPPEPEAPFTPPEPSRRGEITWLQPYPDGELERAADPAPGPAARYQAREAVALAFVAALQRLPPRQTAAVVLRDVLDFSLAEVAAMIDATPTAAKGALQRARATLERDPGLGRRASAPGDEARERELARRFAEAFGADDIDAVVALLTDDAWLAMPPAAHEYHGPEAVAGFLRASARWRGRRRLRLVPLGANAQPAFACYLPDGDGARARARAAGVLVLTLSEGGIAGIERFLDGRLPARLGLPAAIGA